MLQLIKAGKYVVLHQQRQSGKTSYLLELCSYLNSMEQYASITINVESASIREFGNGIEAILDTLSIQCKHYFSTDFDVKNRVAHAGHTLKIEEALIIISQELHKYNKKFILLIDEIDSLKGDTLLSTLRHLRTGSEKRFSGSYPYSVLLVGVRAIKDYFDNINSNVVSAFNIISESLRISRFLRAHIEALVKQQVEKKI